MELFLEIFGLVFGLLLALDGIFGWGLARVFSEAPGSNNRTYVRVSEVIIGLIFIVLAILGLVDVI
jgi:hypothetical protein